MYALLSALVLSAAPATPAIDVDGLDRAVAPGDDFFGFANGGWVKRTEIPPDKSSWGVWGVLSETNRQRTVDLIQEAAKRTDGDALAKKVGDAYAAYMDEAGIEAKGAAPLTPELTAIAAITDAHQLARALGQSLQADVDPLNNTRFHTPHLFGVFVAQALDDPQHHAAYLLQGGLGMPDRDYYLSLKPEQAALRTKYEAYLTQMLTLAGQGDAAAKAKRVLALETKLAQASASRLESEDVHQVTAWPREQFATKAPGLDWAAFFEGAGLSKVSRCYVWQPKALTGLAAVVGHEPLAVWKEWLTAHAVLEHAAYLSQAFVDARFAFEGQALQGTPQQRERWKRGVDFTSDALGDAVGRLYVQRYFSPEARKRAQAMVDAIVVAFGKRIDALGWMSAQTKVQAKQKLATLKVGVGYPDTWVDYASLTISRDDAYGNALRVDRFDTARALAKLDQPVDRGEWWMTPQTINAVNLPLQNALNFPAAILQPPFFDPGPDADPAVNFGAVGAIIGHEISHSFDDSGSQFDAEGRFRNWWTKKDLAHFQAAGERLAKQYDAYEPLPGVHVNGHQTLSENIADVAGLAAAWDAWRATTPDDGQVDAHGFTASQRFFLGFGQAWREKERDAALKKGLITDGHAPAKERAATVRNLDAWYTAFDVKPGQKLALPRAQRAQVW